MMWLAWRQHRRQTLFTAVTLAAVAAFLVPIGLSMRGKFFDQGLDDCARKLAGTRDAACDAALHRFTDQYDWMSMLGVLFLVLPLLIGLFWGAPLVAREVEHGTHRLVWTQGVSRRRWAVVKFGLVGVVTLAAATIFGLGLSWWMWPLAQAGQPRFETFFFDMQGVVPIGYTLFAVALGVFAGTVWHRMLPAMAMTLLGFTATRVLLTTLARPRYQAPETLTFPVVGTGPPPGETGGDWLLDIGVKDASGKLIASNTRVWCPTGATDPGGAPCGAQFGAGPGSYNWQVYQPADRFWLFQSIETGIFVALAVLLLVLALRRIRRIA